MRVRELLEPLGCTCGKTVVDDDLREVRPLFSPPTRTSQRTVYRPGEVCRFDVWQPREEIPVGHGQTRLGWVVVACLGSSRAGAGVLVFSKETPATAAPTPATTTDDAPTARADGALPRPAGPRPRAPTPPADAAAPEDGAA